MDMGWTAEVPVLAGAKDFLFYTPRKPTVEHLIQCVPVALFPTVKRPERKTNLALTSSVEVKNSGATSSLPHMSS
jgi:hypothetical protein